MHIHTYFFIQKIKIKQEISFSEKKTNIHIRLAAIKSKGYRYFIDINIELNINNTILFLGQEKK